MIFLFPLTRTLTIFVRHGVMAHIPWPLINKISGTALSNVSVFNRFLSRRMGVDYSCGLRGIIK